MVYFGSLFGCSLVLLLFDVVSMFSCCGWVLCLWGCLLWLVVVVGFICCGFGVRVGWCFLMWLVIWVGFRWGRLFVGWFSDACFVSALVSCLRLSFCCD